MIERYAQKEISDIWSDANKVRLWTETELAVIKAKVELGLLDQKIYDEIAGPLRLNPVNLAKWKELEKVNNHDLNAFLEERLEYLIPEVRRHFHAGMTSYDTEEPAFAKILLDSCAVFYQAYDSVDLCLVNLARKYRFCPMMARTHGQEAQIQSFGKRCLTWLAGLRIARNSVDAATANLQYSKLSGAIGNYGGLSPEVEKKALAILGFGPFYGATQIMPRQLYIPLASALCGFVQELNKIALDIRLGARSGRPIYREPFGKKQKGSSAMPHKKNTIATEQMEGMARMAQARLSSLVANVTTWEERAIEQSCVERVEWPDLLHIAVHCVKTMARVLKGLEVYPDHMMMEIVDSRGCYASERAKEFLKEKGSAFGISTEDAYRMVQTAAFVVFEPTTWQKEMRKNPPDSLDAVEREFFFCGSDSRESLPIQDIISNQQLKPSEELDSSEAQVQQWNECLGKLFAVDGLHKEWYELFLVSSFLKGEAVLYREIIGE